MQSARRASHPLRTLYRALCLVLLLVAGQQGGVVHELGHATNAQSESSQVVVSAASADGGCMLCPLFAQATTAALSHALHFPLPLRAGIAPVAAPAAPVVRGAVPTPRSRGPPSLS